MYKGILKYHYIIWFLICAIFSAQTPSIDLQSTKEIRQIIAYNHKTEVIDKTTLEEKIKNYYRGLNFIHQVTDSLQIAFHKSYMGVLSFNSMTQESTKNAKKIIAILEKRNSDDLSRDDALMKEAYAGLATNYIGLQQHDSTVWAYKKLIEIDLKKPKTIDPLAAINNLGYHYYNRKKYDSALFYLSQKKDYEDILPLHGEFAWSLYDNIALVCRELDRFPEAKMLFIKNYDFYAHKELDNRKKERRFRAGLQWADIEIRQGNFVKAQQLISDIEKNLNKETNYTRYTESVLLLIKTKKVYAEATKNYKEANQLTINYHHLKDSLNTVKIIQQQKDITLLSNAALNNAAETLKKEQLIIAIEKENLQQKTAKIYWLLIIGFLVSLLVSGYILYKRKQLFSKKTQELQTQYAQSLIKNQEEERIRVSQELHNSVGQKLVLLSKKAIALEDKSAQDLAGNVLEELRSISRNLHPIILTNLGLTKAIESLVNDIDAKTSTFFTHEINLIDHLFSKESTLHLYRIVQELLTNLVTHAFAKAASVTITHKEDCVEISIKDNGKGFDTTAGKEKYGLGLRTILERVKILGAEIHLNSTLNKGTTTILNIPLQKIS
ncbi:ATP-binding protein [Dokdonia sp.]|uniref:tetratricopeptide repeat-containing sensor histidine kinase n=1 Tax=Dokdonia sp. TaxID=2024995 RepID=UPI0032666D6F